MARTVVGLNDPKAVRKYSAMLAVDIGRTSYFGKKFMSSGERAQTPIQNITDLERGAGDNVTYDLSLQLKMKPIQGDSNLRGNEENMRFASDNLFIDQLRGGVNTGGKMTQKRTLINLRETARARQSEWWSRLMDESFFIYLSGARGANEDYIEDTNFTGYAGNAFSAPDSMHLLYGGSATSKATLEATDKFSLALIDKAVSRASTMGGGTAGIPAMQPVTIDGEEHYVLVIHPWQTYDLRTNAGTGGWLDIQKAAAAAEGRNNPMFKGGLGMYNNVIIHEHRGVIRFNDFGAGSNVNAARALFMGRQAAVVAYGKSGVDVDNRYDWTEELEDRGNQVVITTACMIGIKKTNFVVDGVARDFGVIALDTAAKDSTI